MSSSITLSAATRQNLLSLQDTASLLSTTQNRLSTGKKVNSALDSPINFFTSQGLNARSSDLSGLLDGIGNGIQTIQAASQGITNIQKLTDQLKSTANQALSASNAFTAKAAVTSKALNGAVDTNLLSTGATQALGGVLPNIAAATVVASQTGNVAFAADSDVLALTGTKTLTINGTDISLDFDNSISDKAGLLSAINAQTATTGVTATYDASNQLKLTGQANGQSFTVGGTASNVLGTVTSVAGKMTAANVSGSTKALDIGFAPGDSFTVNGASVSISNTDTLDTLAQKVVAATNGDVSAKFDAAADKFTFTAKDAKTAVNLGNGSTSTSLVSQLGFSTTQFAAGLGANGSVADLNGKVLSVQVGTGATAKNVALTFGSSTGQISTLDQLNAALSPADAQATIDSTGHLSITTTNDAGSQKLTVGGSAVGTGNAFLTSSSTATVGGDGQTARNKLVKDYNNLLGQIDQMAKDSGYNGVNLLNGDQMKVSFNADGSSLINVQGVATTSTSLGLNTISASDFVDNDSVNSVFSQITSAVSTLKSQASTYSSNLSVVQNRQDFTKGIINVLDTGASNLTNADLNEEAANSQALSTRNSLAISALSLANQSQQGILQLLR